MRHPQSLLGIQIKISFFKKQKEEKQGKIRLHIAVQLVPGVWDTESTKNRIIDFRLKNEADIHCAHCVLTADLLLLFGRLSRLAISSIHSRLPFGFCGEKNLDFSVASGRLTKPQFSCTIIRKINQNKIDRPHENAYFILFFFGKRSTADKRTPHQSEDEEEDVEEVDKSNES